MDEKLSQEKDLLKYYQNELNRVMKTHAIKEAPLLLFGSSYQTKPARLLHGLIATVLSRFAACWTAIYNEDVRSVLREIPKEQTNIDATFTKGSACKSGMHPACRLRGPR
jgi:hypothetical protein